MPKRCAGTVRVCWVVAVSLARHSTPLVMLTWRRLHMGSKQRSHALVPARKTHAAPQVLDKARPKAKANIVVLRQRSAQRQVSVNRQLHKDQRILQLRGCCSRRKCLSAARLSLHADMLKDDATSIRDSVLSPTKPIMLLRLQMRQAAFVQQLSSRRIQPRRHSSTVATARSAAKPSCTAVAPPPLCCSLQSVQLA
jgi:hypothetical protein